MATEPYLMSNRASIMSAKLLSIRLGLPLTVVGSDWLVGKGFKPYVPTFLAEFEGGHLVQLRSEENLNHREMARILGDDVKSLVNQRSRTTAANATP